MNTSPSSPAAGGARGLSSNLWVPLLFMLAGLAVWEAAVHATGVRPQVLPAPSQVARSGWAQREILGTHALATLQVTLIGFALSLVCAWIIAIAIDFSPTLKRGLTPVSYTHLTLPTNREV